MEIQLINTDLLSELHRKAKENKRLRTNFDLRTTPDDNSQRMLNVMEPGTRVAIHRHLNTSETTICLEGCLDWVFYEEMPDVQGKVPTSDGEHAIDESCFKEVSRVRICPREKEYGIQVPLGIWHSVEVYEPSTILDAKDGKYVPSKM